MIHVNFDSFNEMKDLEIILHRGKYIACDLTAPTAYYAIHSEQSITDLMSPSGVTLGIEIDNDKIEYRVRFYYDDSPIFDYDSVKDKNKIISAAIHPVYNGRQIIRA